MAIVTVDSTQYDLTDGLVTNANEFDFQDLADNSVTWADWTSWDGTGLPSGITPSTTLTFNTEAVDLGAVKNVLPNTFCVTNSSTAHTIKYLISNDNSSYTEVSPAGLTARYVKTKVTITNTSERPGFTQLQTDFIEDTLQESLLNVTVAHDTQDEFELPITKSFGKILAISGTQNSAVSGSYAVIPTDYTTTAPKVKVINLDTYGKVTADVNIDVIVFGLPNVSVLSNGNVSTVT